MGRLITQKYADALLVFDIEKKLIPELQKMPYWNEMSVNQKGSLLSFAYNLGSKFYGSSGFTTISSALKNKYWDKIPDILLMYRNPGTKVEAGLLRRRKAEGELWKK